MISKKFFPQRAKIKPTIYAYNLQTKKQPITSYDPSEVELLLEHSVGTRRMTNHKLRTTRNEFDRDRYKKRVKYI